MKGKKNFTKFLFRLVLLIPAFMAGQSALAQEVIFDDFTDPVKSDTLWEFADRTWSAGDPSNPVHGGVVPELGSIQDGLLVLRGNGNLYTGDIEGHGRNTLVGSCLVSKQKYASGSYEFRAKILPREGALTAFWTFDYETYTNSDSGNINHEIDIEIKKDNGAFNQAFCNTWRYEKVYTHRINNEFFNQDDGEFHLYRFEWHTGGEGITPSVSFYYDDVLKEEITATIPNRYSKLWIGVWFPTWAGTADFETDSMLVDWVKITLFHEANDPQPDQPVEQGPFFDEPLTVPGRIEAEDFDKGSEELAYHDEDSGNTGGAYRTDSDVDIEAWPGGRYAIGYVEDNEWLEYTINCTEAGKYGTWFNVASGLEGGSLHMELDGEVFSEEITFPGTGAWGNFLTYRGPVLDFPAGEHILRIFFDQGDFNIDFMDIADTTGYVGVVKPVAGNSSRLNVYPNPAEKGSLVFLDAIQGEQVLQLFDVSGRLEQKLYLNSEGRISFSAPAYPGWYIIRIMSDNKVRTGSFLVY